MDSPDPSVPPSALNRTAIRFALAALSGTMLALSFPQISLGWLAFFALAPVILAATNARKNVEAMLLGWLALSITWLINVPWVINVMAKYGGLPLPVGIALYVLMSLYLGLYGALFTWLVFRLRPDAASFRRWLLVPAAWIAVEYARTWLLSGFPWNLIAEALVDYRPLVQPARWVGSFGIGYLVALVGTLAAFLFMPGVSRRDGLLASGLTGTVLVVWIAAGAFQLAKTESTLPGEHKMVVGLVQPFIPQEVRWDSDKTVPIFQGLVEQTDDAVRRGAELVVWPESTLPAIFLDTPFWRDYVESVSRASGADFILGSVALDPATGMLWNSAYLVKKGEPTGRYDKIRLVPYGEYVPMRKALFFAEKLVHAVGDFEFGTDPSPLDGKHRYGMAICYEIVFPQIARDSVRRGAELLVTITNDAWFDVSAAPYQHLNMARMRAIENDRWLVRAATTGISAVVDPTGRVIETVPLNERGTIVAKVGLRTGETMSARYGDWPAWICIVAVAAGLVARRRNAA